MGFSHVAGVRMPVVVLPRIVALGRTGRTLLRCGRVSGGAWTA